MARTSGQELLDKVKGLQNGTELSLLILLSPLLLRRSKNEKSSFQRNFFTLFFSKEKKLGTTKESELSFPFLRLSYKICQIQF
ncbi:MAG: hypothetical protein EGS36_07950 [Akkermansia muciniphila]|nr:hypothetical protein [Akkermansia muciniphila]